jgi:hypothetical protein
MLRRLALLSFVAVLTVSCARVPSLAEANRLLEGRWELVLGRDCSNYGIRSDNLILHKNGSLEQHFLSVYGQRYDSSDAHWSYLPDNSISFDTRKNFLTKQPPDKALGLSIHETLLVDSETQPSLF